MMTNSRRPPQSAAVFSGRRLRVAVAGAVPQRGGAAGGGRLRARRARGHADQRVAAGKVVTG